MSSRRRPLLRWGVISSVLWGSSLAGSIGCGPSRQTPSREPVEPGTLPNVRLARIGGDATSLADFAAGRLMVIDMWATWCVACKDTTAKVERLAAAYHDEPRLVVVGVNVGEERARVESSLDDPPRLTTFLDADFRLTDALEARQLPLVLVVSPTGEIAHRGKTLDAQALAVVKRLLDSGARP